MLCVSLGIIYVDKRKIEQEVSDAIRSVSLCTHHVFPPGTAADDPEGKGDRGRRCGAKGRHIPGDQYLYVLLHKPKGYVSSADEPGQKSVLELVPPELCRKDLRPVGRLDKDSTGMLLLTDDGQLAHQVIAARSHVAKYYHIVLARPWEDGYAEKMAEGMVLADGAQCLPAKAAPVEGTDREALICLHEGKYHQVRRMFAAAGNHVAELARIAMGGLEMPQDLEIGTCCVLSEKDVQKMLNCETNFASLLQTLKKHSS